MARAAWSMYGGPFYSHDKAMVFIVRERRDHDQEYEFRITSKDNGKSYIVERKPRSRRLRYNHP